MKYQNYNDDELEMVKYGLEGLYLTITKLVVIIGMSLLLKIFWEVISILLLFNIIRYFGFGIHAKRSIGYWLVELYLSYLIYFGHLLIPLKDHYQITKRKE